jgi:hypothetical protein
MFNLIQTLGSTTNNNYFFPFKAFIPSNSDWSMNSHTPNCSNCNLSGNEFNLPLSNFIYFFSSSNNSDICIFSFETEILPERTNCMIPKGFNLYKSLISERFPDFETKKSLDTVTISELLSFIIFWICFSSNNRAESILNIFSKRSFLHQYDKSLNDFNLFSIWPTIFWTHFSVVWTTIMNLETFSISDSETFKLIMLICLLRIYLIFCSIDQGYFLNKQK